MFKYNLDLNSFMNINKKGVHSHIIIIVISSFVMTILFLTLFSSIFKNDNIKCQDLDFSVIKSSKLDNGAKIRIKNNVGVPVNFDLIGDSSSRVIVDGLATADFSVVSDSSVEIIPVYISIINKDEYKCKGKSLSLNINTLISG